MADQFKEGWLCLCVSRCDDNQIDQNKQWPYRMDDAHAVLFAANYI